MNNFLLGASCTKMLFLTDIKLLLKLEHQYSVQSTHFLGNSSQNCSNINFYFSEYSTKFGGRNSPNFCGIFSKKFKFFQDLLRRVISNLRILWVITKLLQYKAQKSRKNI